MDAAVFARAAQYAAVAIVGGSSLTLARTPGAAWPRGLTAGAALIGAAGVAAWLIAQAQAIAGDAAQWPSIALDTGFGHAAIVRGLVLLIAAGVALARPRHAPLAGLGGVAAASFAWTGHGGADDGAAGLVHLGADIVHLLAAMIWLGALPVLAWLTVRQPSRATRALSDFSAIGPALVALIVLSGAVNSWFLVGPAQALHLTDSLYGRLLAGKLVLFGLMLALAAANRWRLGPALDRAIEKGAPPPRALIAALSVETLLGAAVLALVAWMGTVPPAAHG